MDQRYQMKIAELRRREGIAAPHGQTSATKNGKKNGAFPAFTESDLWWGQGYLSQ